MIKTRFAASALAALFFATLFNPAPAATTTPDQPVTVQDTGTSLILGRGVILFACLHFGENERSAIAGDDVHFAQLAAEVAFEDSISQSAKKL